MMNLFDIEVNELPYNFCSKCPSILCEGSVVRTLDNVQHVIDGHIHTCSFICGYYASLCENDEALHTLLGV